MITVYLSGKMTDEEIKEYWRASYCNEKHKKENLEKENAELKKQLEMSNKVYNDNLDYSHHIEGQLTKAKKIIEKVAKMYRYSPRVEEIIAEAEQFLKYSEVEK